MWAERSRIFELNIQIFAEKDIKNQDSNSLKRAMRKYEKNIALHDDKINNPKKYVKNWDALDARRQNGLKKHWEKEKRNFQDSINNRIEELKKRGDFNG